MVTCCFLESLMLSKHNRGWDGLAGMIFSIPHIWYKQTRNIFRGGWHTWEQYVHVWERKHDNMVNLQLTFIPFMYGISTQLQVYTSKIAGMHPQMLHATGIFTHLGFFPWPDLLSEDASIFQPPKRGIQVCIFHSVNKPTLDIQTKVQTNPRNISCFEY